MTLSTLATLIFLVAFLGVGGLWGLVVGEGEGSGEEEEEEEVGGLWARRGGGYVELSAAASKRGGSVDGGLEGSQQRGGGSGLDEGVGATHFRIADEEDVAAVVL